MRKITFFLAAAILTAGCKENTETALSRIVLEEDQISISYKGGENSIAYQIENPIGDQLPYAEPDQQWLHSFDCSTLGEIRFIADENPNEGARSANVTISYDGAKSVIVTVRQLTSSDAGDAVITILSDSLINVPATGGDVEVLYVISSYDESQSIEMTSSESWAADYDTPEYGRVVVHTQINFDTSVREAELTFSYPGAEPASLTLVQAAGDAEPPFTINVTDISEREATVSWFPDDKSMTYVNGLVPKSYMDEYAGNLSEFIEDEVLNLRYQAEQSGMELSAYLRNVLQQGDVGRKWNSLDPASEYCAIAFGLSLSGEVLTGLAVERFSTKKVDQLDCTFTFEDTEITPTSLKVRVTPDNESVRYYADIISKSEYDGWGSDQALMDYISYDIETWIWIYEQNPQLGITATWADYTEIGTCETEATELFSETEYYAFAFGLDEGLITTNLQKQVFTTKAVDITDDCTFEVSAQATASYMADIEIVPTNSSTRYYVEVIESAAASQYKVNDMATMMLNAAIENGILNTYSYSGSQSLNTLFDMDVAPLSPSTDYTVFIFGVENGKRTTEVATQQFRTKALQPSSMTFDLSVTNVGTNSVTLQCTPSSNNEYFIMGCIPVEQYDGYESGEAFAREVIAFYSQSILGVYGTAGCMGETVRDVTTDVFYNNLTDQTEYFAFAFGYMGDITTDVTTLRFSTSGKVYSRADVSMECELINGMELYYQDPYKYPYEDYYNFAVFNFTLTPNEYADRWYFATINNASIDEVRRMDENELRDILRTQGEYKPYEAMRREYWYTTIVAVILPVDEYGEYGEMVIESFYADPNAAGLLAPSASYRGTTGSSVASAVPFSTTSQLRPGLRPWNGVLLKELPESGDRQQQVRMTRTEAEAAMKEHLLDRFPESRAIEHLK